MARLKVTINDDLMPVVLACIERIWPGEGMRALGRFVRDAIKRYLRYCDGGSRNKHQR
jgi:hypothetical protein